MSKLLDRARRVGPVGMGGQRGITGLETAIVLIAFVVVSSVFAFAALSTGLFTSDKSKETIHAGLSEARGTLEVRGSVISKKHASNNSIDELYFQVANAAGGEAVNLNPEETIIKYTDVSQSHVFTGSNITVTGLGNADTDKLVETSEIYEIKLTGLDSKLNPDLTTSDAFTLEVIPPQSAVLHIERRAPVLLESYNDLG